MSRCRACAVVSVASRTAYSTWTPQKPTLFDGHYLRNRLTLDIGVLDYIGIVQHKEHPPEVLFIPPGTPCICAVREMWEKHCKAQQTTDNNMAQGHWLYAGYLGLQTHTQNM